MYACGHLIHTAALARAAHTTDQGLTVPKQETPHMLTGVGEPRQNMDHTVS